MWVIEAHLPSSLAYELDCHARARQLFASLGVWDTAHNTGILLYINLCAKQVVLLADRGVHAHMPEHYWQTACTEMSQAFAQGQYKQGVVEVLQQLNVLLQQRMPTVASQANELVDSPLMLD